MESDAHMVRIVPRVQNRGYLVTPSRTSQDKRTNPTQTTTTLRKNKDGLRKLLQSNWATSMPDVSDDGPNKNMMDVQRQIESFYNWDVMAPTFAINMEWL